MKIVECTSCGSKELIENNGIVVCVYCQTRYLPDTGSPLVIPVCRVGPCEEPTMGNSVYCSEHSRMKIVRKEDRMRRR